MYDSFKDAEHKPLTKVSATNPSSQKPSQETQQK